MVDMANTIFRDFVTDGVPASGPNKPRKSKVREWGAWLEGLISGGTAVTTATSLAALKAVDTATFQKVTLLVDGRFGDFAWNAGDYSAQVAADTAGGIYVKADAIAASTGAWVRQFKGHRSAKWFGVVGDGVTDDTAALTVAFSNAASGCAVLLPDGCNPLVDTTFTLPSMCSLVGTKPVRGGAAPSTQAALVTRIYVNPAATISVGSGSTIRNIGIFRKGLTFNITSAQVAAQFLGTAITVRDNVADVLVEDCWILGFNQAARSIAGATSVSRVTFNRVTGDCQNGIFLEASNDVTRLRDCHFWPFVTINSTPEANGAQNDRSGTAFSLKAANDWTRLDGCFAFAYATGYLIDAADQVILSNCGADGHAASPLAGTIGFRLINSAADIKLIGCQAAAQDIAFQSDTTSVATAPVTFTACNAWECLTDDFKVTSGAAVFANCQSRRTGAAAGGGSSGYNIGATAIVDIDNCQIYGRDIGIKNAVGAVTRHRGVTFSGILTSNVVNPYVPTVATAATVALNGIDLAFKATGTTIVTGLSNAAAYAGKTVSLTFAAATRIASGAGLNVSGSYYVQAGETVSFYSDGTTWYPQGDKFSKTVITVSAAGTIALSNSSTTAQNVFAAANDEISVTAGTMYRFRARIKLNTGATSHSTAFGLGGTATFTSIGYTAISKSSAAATPAAANSTDVETAASTVVVPASTAATTSIVIEGIMRINAAGTIIPQVTFSAGPTGTCETAIDSFFEVEKIAANTSAAVGNSG